MQDYQAFGDGEFGQTRDAVDIQLAHDVLAVCFHGANTDSEKPTWVAKSVSAARSVGAKAMLWFNETAEHNWRLDSSSPVLSSARTALHSSTITYAGRTDANGVRWTLARIDQLVSTGK